jgi:diaminopropionate ammonia-lyase
LPFIGSSVKRWAVPNLSFAELMSDEIRAAVGDITFTSATDGNHGKGLAWAARKLGFPCVIYVHKNTSQARIAAIAEYDAEVRVVDGNYDDAVRQCERDARANGWQVISDTSWPGYEEVPMAVMQGYTTLLARHRSSLRRKAIIKPTHIFLQAGVGAFAAAMIAFYEKLFGADAPIHGRRGTARGRLSLSFCRSAMASRIRFRRSGYHYGRPGLWRTQPIGLGNPLELRRLHRHRPDYVAAKGMRMYGVPLKGDPVVISGESGPLRWGCCRLSCSTKARPS